MVFVRLCISNVGGPPKENQANQLLRRGGWSVGLMLKPHDLAMREAYCLTNRSMCSTNGVLPPFSPFQDQLIQVLQESQAFSKALMSLILLTRSPHDLLAQCLRMA